MVLVPGALILFYRSRHVLATCDGARPGAALDGRASAVR